MTADYPKPPFPAQKQPMPGSTDAMQPRPDHGETSYKGSGKLNGMKAVITGGDSGIGRAVAIAFAREGADVLIAFLDETEEANEVKKLIEKEGRKAVLVPGDLQDAKHCREVIKKAVDSLGGIDILVNNAAVRAEQAFENMTLAQWRAVTSIILDGAFNCVQACLPYLKKSGAGAIVNIGGLSAHTGAARRPHVVTAKAGLIGFTRALAHELADDKIRVNTVTPGLMAAPRPAGQPEPQHHPLVHALVGRRGQPDDIASAVRFICGPGAAFITGQNIQVNGGTYLG
jgi:3-oxoacyl-[acyl-carrier protein] reductase